MSTEDKGKLISALVTVCIVVIPYFIGKLK